MPRGHPNTPPPIGYLNGAGRRWGGQPHPGRGTGCWSRQHAQLEQHRLYTLLTTQLPAECHTLLVGRTAILDYLTKIGLTDRAKRRLHWTTIRRWQRFHGFPLLPGKHKPSRHAPLGLDYAAAVTSTSAVIAWLLSRMCTGEPAQVYLRRPT